MRCLEWKASVGESIALTFSSLPYVISPYVLCVASLLTFVVAKVVAGLVVVSLTSLLFWTPHAFCSAPVRLVSHRTPSFKPHTHTRTKSPDRRDEKKTNQKQRKQGIAFSIPIVNVSNSAKINILIKKEKSKNSNINRNYFCAFCFALSIHRKFVCCLPNE